MLTLLDGASARPGVVVVATSRTHVNQTTRTHTSELTSKTSQARNCIIQCFCRPHAIDAALRRPGLRHHIAFTIIAIAIATVTIRRSSSANTHNRYYLHHRRLNFPAGRLDREFSIAPPSPTARAAILSALTSALHLTPPDRVTLVCALDQAWG